MYIKEWGDKHIKKQMDTKHKPRLNRQKHFERGGGAFDRIWHFIWGGAFDRGDQNQGASDRGGGRLTWIRLKVLCSSLVLVGRIIEWGLTVYHNSSYSIYVA